MSGGRLRLIVHDGDRVRDNRPVTKEFQGKKVMDITKRLYHTQSAHYKKLGEEITAIGDIRKSRDSGFQLYVAVIKDNKVLEMGLPFMEMDEKRFLNPNNIKIDDLDSALEHLPENVELALVWRLDKNMTQDIEIKGNSVIKSVSDSGLDFSLANKKGGSCGLSMDNGVQLVADIMEVKIYCGEEDDQIRMSMLMVAPPSVDSWDFSGDFIPPSYPVINHQIRTEGRRDELWNISEFNIRTLHEKTEERKMIIPVENLQEINKPQDAVEPQKTSEAAVAGIFVLSETPEPEKIRLEENPIIRLIMNPTERKLWGKLYGFPDGDDKGQPPPMLKISKAAAVKVSALKLQKLPKIKQLQKEPEQKIRKEKIRKTDFVQTTKDSAKQVGLPVVEIVEGKKARLPGVHAPRIKTENFRPERLEPVKTPKAGKIRKEKTKKRKKRRPVKTEKCVPGSMIKTKKNRVHALKVNVKAKAKKKIEQVPKEPPKIKLTKKAANKTKKKRPDIKKFKRRTRARNSLRRLLE